MKIIKLILILIIVLSSAHAFGWTSSARRFQQSSRSARHQYMDNRKVQGNMSTAARHMRNYNEPVHLGPSETLIRSRIVIPIDIQKRYKKMKEMQRKCLMK
jgi:beta-lactamase regulating signal transducer with metallopeptidase domain